MRHPLAAIFLLELLYLAVARAFTNLDTRFNLFDPATGELLWSAWRMVCALLAFLIFRKLLTPERSVRATWRSGGGLQFIGWLAILLFLACPALSAGYGLASPLNIIFAATSFAVGFREEIVYRGILQRVLTKRFGLVASLIISNLLFAIYHYGAIPLTAPNLFEFFVAGLFLGVLFHLSGSIVLVSLLHSAYDALYAVGPLVASPLDRSHTLGLLAIAAMLSILRAIAHRRSLS